jgi:biopolymer transport protein ExbD
MMRSRRTRRRMSHSLPELNLTPMIDTAFTLLVIFMVTTPVIHNSLKIDLPRGQSQEAGKQTQQELVVAVDEKGVITFNGKVVALKDLGAIIKKHIAALGAQSKRVWVRIDRNRPCDMLLGVIDKIKVVAGVQDVAIAMEKSGVT